MFNEDEIRQRGDAPDLIRLVLHWALRQSSLCRRRRCCRLSSLLHAICKVVLVVLVVMANRPSAFDEWRTRKCCFLELQTENKAKNKSERKKKAPQQRGRVGALVSLTVIDDTRALLHR